MVILSPVISAHAVMTGEIIFIQHMGRRIYKDSREYTSTYTPL